MFGLNEAARAELEEIRREHGELVQPRAVVARARSRNSALHKYFEWDDDAAAEAYRMQQARAVLRAVVSILPRADGGMVETRAYLSLPSDRAKGGYRPITEIIGDEVLSSEAARELERAVLRLRAKFSAFSDLRGALEEMVDAARQAATRTKV